MKIQCPMPQMDFERITLGHGSGGLLTQRLLNQCIFKQLDNEFLRKQDDGAIIKLTGKVAFSTDSFVVSPIFFPGGNIGDLAIHGTVNDLAVCGAKPKYLSLGLIIEEGLLVSEFWDILCAISQACYKAGVKVITGDTKVVEKGKGDQIFINTTGIGEILPEANIEISNIQIGDKIIVTGPIASHGAAILSKRKGLDFDTEIQSDSAPLNHMVEKILQQFKHGIHFLRDATRGGVAAVLNEIVSKLANGISIMETEIPVLDPVRDLCEILGIDPLYVANEGVIVVFVDEKIADEVVKTIRNQEFGQKAKIIGEINDQMHSKVVLHSRIGGKRIVHMPLAEQLPRIC